MKVLIVEDHPDVANGIAANLRAEGYVTMVAGDGVEGLAAVRRWSPDLIILDLMLPRLDGFAVLEQLRAEHDLTPVLILSARDAEVDKVRGFRIGADDYVTKPFGLAELLARVHALCRRAAVGSVVNDPESLTFGSLQIVPPARQVFRDGAGIELRPKEFDLLMALIHRKRRAVSRQTLLREVWGYDPRVESRTVDWHIAELRRKIGDDLSAPRFISTVRKVGYRWDAEPTA